MGMTVDNVSYLTGMRQNTRVSTAEKQEQKETAAEVGKTRQSGVSASLDQVNMGEDGIAITEVSRQQGTEQSAAQKQPPAPRMCRQSRNMCQQNGQNVAAAGLCS